MIIIKLVNLIKMKKQLLILYICFLIATLVPASAVVNSKTLSGKTEEINKNQNGLADDNNKMLSDVNTIKYHSKVLQDTLNQMNGIKWYQFWKYKFFLYDGPAKIDSESKAIESLSKNLNNSANNMGDNAISLKDNANSSLEMGLDIANQDLNVNTINDSYNTGNASINANIIANKLSSNFQVDYTVTSPKNLESGDIVQYPLSHNNYVYLQYVGMNPKGDKTLFLGDHNTAVRLSASQLETIKFKISPNKLETTTQTTTKNLKTTTEPTIQNTTTGQTSYIANIQKEGLKNYMDKKIEDLNNKIRSEESTRSTGSNLMIASGAVGAAGALLFSIAVIIFYVTIGLKVAATVLLSIYGLCLLTVVAALALLCIIMGISYTTTTLDITIGSLGLLSVALGLIAGILLPVGGGIYGYANSVINELNGKKNDVEKENNLIDKDLKSYNDGNTNNIPVVQNSSINMEKNGNLTGMLNATDADGDSSNYDLVNKPAHGDLTLIKNGSYTYKPVNGFVGNDSFTFKANDIYGDSNTAKIMVTVHPLNHLPVSTDMNFDVEQNNNITGYLKSTDEDKDPITYCMVNNTSNGNITVNDNGSFIYIPADGFTGNDTFTYRAMDWIGNGNVATVKINIHPPNHLPVAENMTFRVAENENITGKLLATDGDGDNILYQIVNKSIKGTIKLNIDGTFTYTPGKGKVGNDTFTYLANDWLGQSNLGMISIEIYEFNHPPVAQNTSISTIKNKSYTGLFKATDIDNNNLTFKIVNKPHHGTIIILKSDRFTYTPKIGFIGNDNFTYYAYDGKNKSNTVTVLINVTNKKLKIIHENILTRTDNAISQSKFATATKAILTQQSTPGIQELSNKLNPKNITPQNNTQNSTILTNNPMNYILTIINSINDHINAFIKQITAKLSIKFI